MLVPSAVNRPGPFTRGHKKSHFQFKNWVWDKESGKRLYAEAVDYPLRREYPNLLNTCYNNPATGTKTVFCVQWDLDAHRADERWKNKNGKLKDRAIIKFLQKEHPELLKYVFALTRSTSGMGLSLAIAISPLELVGETQTAQNAARAMQLKVLELLNNYGMGADPGALGLERDFPNPFNDQRRVYGTKLVLDAVQSEGAPVVKELLTYLNKLSILAYQKKSEREDLLWPNITAERKLAELFIEALEDWGWSLNGPAGEATLQLSTQEIMQRTGLSRSFLGEFLKDPPRWLKAQWLGNSEGWRITIVFDPILTARAYTITGTYHNQRDSSSRTYFPGTLLAPSEVMDGERNPWFTQAILLLKHNGTDEQTATAILRALIPQIPGYQTSRNCKYFEQTVRILYRNKPQLFGIRPGCAPAWLLAAAVEPVRAEKIVRPEVPSTIPLSNKAPEGLSSFFKRGTKSPGLLERQISADGCFVFSKNFYSVPREFIGQELIVFRWNNRLRIYDEAGKHVYTHEIVSGRGQYVIAEEHVYEIDDAMEKTFEWRLGRFEALGDELGEFARGLYERYGVFALRRFWTLRALVRKHGAANVDAACAQTSNLGGLMKILGKNEKSEFCPPG